MVFSSFEFLFRFLPVFLLMYYVTPQKWKNAVLFAGSILFYTAGEAEYVVLLLASVVINYVFGRLMYPAGLTGEAQEIYEAYVREHGAQTAAHLTDTGNMDALREMSRRRLWTDQSLDAAVEYAASKSPGRRGRGAERREILSFLMNEKQRFFPVRKGKYEL